MKKIYLLLLTLIVLISIKCKNETFSKVTNTKNYNEYLISNNKTKLLLAKEEYNFWKTRLYNTPKQYPYYSKLASANTQLFNASGNVKYLKEAEENLLKVNNNTNYNNAGYLRALAKNYISQHRFKESLSLLKKAEKNGENLNQTNLMLVDVYLELGDLKNVETYLSKVKNLKSFDYLIRLSKYNDHIGDLDNAITYLEQSLVIAKASKKESLLEWNYSNLGDYYGHAGRIKDSYEAYLKALDLNPSNSYAKKGIAWIVFSHERNPKEALRILNYIIKENESPDYYLLKSEIADFMGNTKEKERQIKMYLNSVSKESYGVMYAKYNVLLYTNELGKNEEALQIAENEVKERPTPQSYSLLAWASYKNGNISEAKQIVNENVLGKTFEPEALLQAAIILKEEGNTGKVLELKQELLGAIYELGPNTEKEIKNL